MRGYSLSTSYGLQAVLVETGIRGGASDREKLKKLVTGK